MLRIEFAVNRLNTYKISDNVRTNRFIDNVRTNRFTSSLEVIMDHNCSIL